VVYINVTFLHTFIQNIFVHINGGPSSNLPAAYFKLFVTCHHRVLCNWLVTALSWRRSSHVNLLCGRTVVTWPCCCYVAVLLLRGRAVVTWPCCCYVAVLLLRGRAVVMWPCCCYVAVLLLCGRAFVTWPCCCYVAVLLFQWLFSVTCSTAVS